MGALSAFEPYAADNADPASRLRACMRLISRMPTLAALAYRTSMGYPLIYPRVLLLQSLCPAYWWYHLVALSVFFPCIPMHSTPG